MLFQQTSVSRNRDSGTAFGKICTISKYFCRSSLKITFKYFRNYEVENVKTISRPAESTNLISQNPKYNPLFFLVRLSLKRLYIF
jgi:hypothetical protein